jgi:hypothetical protein
MPCRQREGSSCHEAYVADLNCVDLIKHYELEDTHTGDVTVLPRFAPGRLNPTHA